MKLSAVFWWFGLSLSLFIAQITTAQKRDRISVEEYINTYKDIAIREMDRTGIPASITLAQGIHESGAGNSRLATEAKNHFGIKCGGKWDGKTYYKWDDESSESCFRVYENAEASYLDHSAILQKDRYKFLFDYDKTDYKKWAKGLKKAGYATDPRYPQKLINTIEQHQLSQYDLAMPTVVVNIQADTNYQEIITDPKEIFVIPEETYRPLRKKARSFLFPAYKKGFFRTNGASYVIAKKGETALEVATRMDIPYRKFLKFNDLVDGDQLIAYQPCYIQPKRSRYRGNKEHFRVTNDITLYEIAQQFGIKLEDLYKRNMMEEGDEARNGEIIMLNKQVSVPPALRMKSGKDMLPVDPTDKDIPTFPKEVVKKDPTPIPEPKLKVNEPTYPDSIYNNNINTTIEPDERYLKADPVMPDKNVDWVEELEKQIQEEEDSIRRNTPSFPDTPTNEDNFNSGNNSGNDLPPVRIPEIKEDPVEEINKLNYKIHIVKKGETLFSLGRLYQISWKELKSFNQLTNDNIKENQTLKIPKK
jgi:LysM repeat protein